MQIETKTGRIDLEDAGKDLRLDATEFRPRGLASIGITRKQALVMAHALAVYGDTGQLPEHPLPLTDWRTI